MKIGAISGRGTKRDFVDVYFLSKYKFSLRQILNFYDKKYKNLKNIFPHLIKSLVYFEDAEGEEMRPMLKPCDWEKVKRFCLIQTPKIIDQELEKLEE